MEELNAAIEGAMTQLRVQSEKHRKKYNRIVAKSIRNALLMPTSNAHQMLVGIAEMLEEQ